MPPPRAGLIPLYPMGLGEVIDTAFTLLRRCAAPALLLVALLIGPVQILSSLGFTSPFALLEDPTQSPDLSAGQVSAAVLGGILALIVGPLASGAVTWLGIHATATYTPTWQEALSAAWRRYWSLLGAQILLFLLGLAVMIPLGGAGVLAATAGPAVLVLVGIPLALLAVGVVIAFFGLSYLVVPVILVEEARAGRAIRRAWWLARSRFWPLLGILLVAGVLLSALGFAVGGVFQAVAFIPFPGSWVFLGIGGTLNRMVVVPVAAYLALTVYVDVRTRSEGYDISVLASQLQR